MAAAQPDLAPGEQALAETPLGRDVAMLTDRRVIVAGPALEQSVPLAHIALVRVRFERKAGAIVGGAILVAVALLLFGVASPLRTLLLNQGVALEPAAAQERAIATQEGSAGGGLASGMQRILGVAARLAGAFPALGWVLLILGVVRIVLGAIGRTVVTIAGGGAEVEFSRFGNSLALREFVAEVGRRLPVPARAPR